MIHIKKMISLLWEKEKEFGSVKMDEVFFYDPYKKEIDIIIDMEGTMEKIHNYVVDTLHIIMEID